MSFRYKDVETALATTMGVKPRQLGAFRARLRHLRNLGLPTRLQTPGSGKHIAYSARQVFELLIALELESLGQAPRTAAVIAASIVRHVPLRRNLGDLDSGDDMYAAIDPSLPRGWIGLFTRNAFQEYMSKAPMRFSMLNLSLSGRALDQALNEATVNG